MDPVDLKKVMALLSLDLLKGLLYNLYNSFT